MADNGTEQTTVTLTIDGQEITVPRGTTLLKAAERLGTKVPHYCYHDGLSSPAMCRLCLVEIEGAPKLQPSCVTVALDGQVVHTDSEKARRMREGVLEFYLVNHPLDCPICDQSGECKLQDYVHAEGRAHGRSREPKRVFGRDDFGKDVLFYGDRCVMCTRCVRFMNEMEEEPRLTVVERGNRSVIDTFFEDGLEGTHWSGNIVDICPVGALVSKDFLHKQRAWDLDHTPSVCPSCSQGCNIALHTRDNLVQRLKPRANLDVNAYWMCDYGRGNYEFINRQGRLDTPRTADGPASWRDALHAFITRARELEGVPVRAVASPRASNEDLGALRALLDALGGGEIVYRIARAPDEAPLKGMPSLARRRELAPNHTGAELLGAVRVGDDDGAGGLDDLADHDGILLVLGDALEDVGADFGSGAALFAWLGTHATPASGNAHYVFPITTFAEQEGSFTNRDRRVQRFWPGLQAPGDARPAWLILGALASELSGDPAVTTAAQAFDRMVSMHEPFAGLQFATLGTRGAVLNEPVSLAGD
ncbi:MAG: 2Fe-2S iron-sulfur cluster-binding protein [Gemmatimonadota bacterium]